MNENEFVLPESRRHTPRLPIPRQIAYRVQEAREAARQRSASLGDEDHMHMEIDVVDEMLAQVTRPAHHVPR